MEPDAIAQENEAMRNRIAQAMMGGPAPSQGLTYHDSTTGIDLPMPPSDPSSPSLPNTALDAPGGGFGASGSWDTPGATGAWDNQSSQGPSLTPYNPPASFDQRFAPFGGAQAPAYPYLPNSALDPWSMPDDLSGGGSGASGSWPSGGASGGWYHDPTTGIDLQRPQAPISSSNYAPPPTYGQTGATGIGPSPFGDPSATQGNVPTGPPTPSSMQDIIANLGNIGSYGLPNSALDPWPSANQGYFHDSTTGIDLPSNFNQRFGSLPPSTDLSQQQQPPPAQTYAPAEPPPSSIVRTNPDGSIAGNISTQAPAPPPAPTPAPSASQGYINPYGSSASTLVAGVPDWSVPYGTGDSNHTPWLPGQIGWYGDPNVARWYPNFGQWGPQAKFTSYPAQSVVPGTSVGHPAAPLFDPYSGPTAGISGFGPPPSSSGFGTPQYSPSSGLAGSGGPSYGGSDFAGGGYVPGSGLSGGGYSNTGGDLPAMIIEY